jgi:hypothetical protein
LQAIPKPALDPVLVRAVEMKFQLRVAGASRCLRCVKRSPDQPPMQSRGTEGTERRDQTRFDTPRLGEPGKNNDPSNTIHLHCKTITLSPSHGEPAEDRIQFFNRAFRCNCCHNPPCRPDNARPFESPSLRGTPALRPTSRVVCRCESACQASG